MTNFELFRLVGLVVWGSMIFGLVAYMPLRLLFVKSRYDSAVNELKEIRRRNEESRDRLNRLFSK